MSTAAEETESLLRADIPLQVKRAKERIATEHGINVDHPDGGGTSVFAAGAILIHSLRSIPIPTRQGCEADKPLGLRALVATTRTCCRRLAAGLRPPPEKLLEWARAEGLPAFQERWLAIACPSWIYLMAQIALRTWTGVPHDPAGGLRWRLAVLTSIEELAGAAESLATEFGPGDVLKATESNIRESGLGDVLDALRGTPGPLHE